MDYKVVLSPSARKDVREIVRYISLDAPSRALAFGESLISNTKRLGHYPEMGRIVPEFGDPEIREISVRNYRVVYRVDHPRKKVLVIRFWHGARSTPELPTL